MNETEASKYCEKCKEVTPHTCSGTGRKGMCDVCNTEFVNVHNCGFRTCTFKEQREAIVRRNKKREARMVMADQFKVYFSEDYIKILKSDTMEEMVGWHQDEWEEDPQVVFSIVNATIQALRYPKMFKTTLEAKYGRQEGTQGSNETNVPEV